MFEKIEIFDKRYSELSQRLYEPSVAADPEQYQKIMKENKKDNLFKKIFLLDIKIGEKYWFLYFLLSCLLWGLIGSVLYILINVVIKL